MYTTKICCINLFLIKYFEAVLRVYVLLVQGGGGSALGLWISQEILKLHGSKIVFSVVEGGIGTKFSFLLPAYKSVLSDDYLPVSNHPSRVSISYNGHADNSHDYSHSSERPVSNLRQVAPEVNSLHILERRREYEVSDNFGQNEIRLLKTQGVCRFLIVDDSALNVKIMVRHLLAVHRENPNLFLDSKVGRCGEDASKLGKVTMETVEADDGTSALSRLQEASEDGRPFDAVFMDNIMNRMNGPEAAQAMRATGYDGLIIGVTGNVMAKDVNHYLSCGADHILFKPVNLEELTGILRSLRAI